MGYKVPIGISNRHIHLTQEAVETLFGEGHKLTVKKELIQPTQFAAEEKVDIVGPKTTLKGVRVLGDVRNKIQLEISMTDARTLGMKVPVKESGHHDGTPGCKIVGPCGEVDIEDGVIVALRHLHFDPETAKEAGVKDKEWVSIRLGDQRAVVFENTLCRVSENYRLECHIDTDEANAAGIGNGEFCEIIK